MQIKKETANKLEYKDRNNANIARFVKTSNETPLLYVKYVLLWCVCGGGGGRGGGVFAVLSNVLDQS